MIVFGNQVTQFLVECAENIILELKDRKEKLIEEAREIFYKKARQKASYETEISKQTIKIKLINQILSQKCQKKKSKKKVKRIYIIADKNYVHLQKGGIEEPRLIIVYDSIVAKVKNLS